ncbi:MAG: 3-hydroxybutyrate dehydrogenase [Caldilineaceae bacterium]|nr:3-hydroxybutyrate dehydrogenase [Caldilineaceae bacterium]
MSDLLSDLNAASIPHASSARVAIVTGGAGGIGRAIAKALQRAGHQVVVADRQFDAAQAVATEVDGLALAVELAQAGSCRNLVAQTVAHYGRVDILVNNAGFQHIAPIEEFPDEVWETMLAVMLTAPFLLTKAVWPYMKAQGWGRIVNLGSIHSVRASPFKVGYITAKHGLLGLTRTAAREGGEWGITVNALLPSYVRTPLVEGQIADQARTRNLAPDEVVDRVFLAQAAIKRLIEPDEVGSLVAYLCSDAAAPITGVDWAIDVGWTA